MAIEVSYPGVYLQEIPNSNPVVAGVSTSSTAFVDFFPRGPMNRAVRLTSMLEFERTFGGLDTRSEASYGLSQYFLNGGQTAWVIRVGDGNARAASFGIDVQIPSLSERQAVAQSYFDRATSAANAATKAANQAVEALSELPSLSGDDAKDKTTDLQEFVSETATQTETAAGQTRLAAEQAAVSSEQLAIEIGQLESAGGLTNFAVDAALASAQAAVDTANNAGQTVEIIKGANTALDTATALSSNIGNLGNSRRVADSLQEASTAMATVADLTKNVGGAAGTTDADIAITAANDASKAVAAALDAARATKAAADGAASKLGLTGDDASKLTQPANDMVNYLMAPPGSLPGTESLSQKATDAVVAAQSSVSPADATQAAEDAINVANRAMLLMDPDAKDSSDKALESSIEKLADIDPTKISVTQSGNDILAQIKDPASSEALTAYAFATAEDVSEDKDIAPLLDEKSQVSAVLKTAVRTIVISENDAVDAVANANTAAQAADNAAQIVNPILARGVLNDVKQLQTDLEKQQTNDVRLLARIRQTGGDTNSAAAQAQSASQEIPTIIDDDKASFSDKSQQVLSKIDDALSTANTALGATNQLVAAAAQTAGLAELAANAASTAAESANVAVEASKEGAKDPLLIINAINPGLWGDNLVVNLERPDPNAITFNLQIQEVQISGNTSRVANQEMYYNLTLVRSETNNVFDTLSAQSQLATATSQGALLEGAYPNDAKNRALENGADGGLADGSALVAGLAPLDKIAPDIFNLLCLPATGNMGDSEARFVIAQASVFCGDRRAFYIVDIPASVDTVDKATTWTSPIRSADAIHAATYYPRLSIADPLNNFRPRNVGASGTMAGIYARTDTAIGVWKAPAGVDGVLRGAELAVPMTDDQNGQINQLGINGLRNFPVYGNLSWGARTLAGADLLQSEYKYINVRRLMNFVEESIFQSMKWAVFQSNNQALWSKINLQISTFLAGLFADGAFNGASPATTFFVKVDGTTTSPVDIEMGIVNVMIGIAPIKPAEFIVLKFQQIAGQTGS